MVYKMIYPPQSWVLKTYQTLLLQSTEVTREQPAQLLHSLLLPALGLGDAARELGLALQVLGQDQVTVLLCAQSIQNSANEAARVLAVGLHMTHDHLDVNILGSVPAIVVSSHANHLVCDLGLASKLSLGQGRHVDDGAAPAPVQVRLSAGGELGALYGSHQQGGPSRHGGCTARTHADQRAAVVQRDALAFQTVAALPHNLCNALVKGVAETDVADHAALEEGEGADPLGAVDDLIGHHEVARADLLLQAADGAEGDDGAHADTAEGGNVGAVGHLVRRELVVQAMARQEGDGDGLAGGRGRVVEDGDGRGGLAPRRADVEGRGESEVGQRLQAGAADDSNVDGVWRSTELSARRRRGETKARVKELRLCEVGFTRVGGSNVGHDSLRGQEHGAGGAEREEKATAERAQLGWHPRRREVREILPRQARSK